MELAGKVAVVTGASSGLGQATASALADKGMRVVAVARRQERLDALAAQCSNIRPYAADVTSAEQVTELARWVGDSFGNCHVLVNSAGARGSSRFRGSNDVDDVARTMDLNFMGIVRCMGAFAELLFASAPSNVVNIASVGGKIAAIPPAYAASKFATVGFSEAVAARWAREGVTVSQLNPGLIATEGFPQDYLHPVVKPMLLGTPDKVAQAAVDVIRRGTWERTVPRRYRPLVLLRHLCPPLYRAALRRL